MPSWQAKRRKKKPKKSPWIPKEQADKQKTHNNNKKGRGVISYCQNKLQHHTSPIFFSRSERGGGGGVWTPQTPLGTRMIIGPLCMQQSITHSGFIFIHRWTSLNPWAKFNLPFSNPAYEYTRVNYKIILFGPDFHFLHYSMFCLTLLFYSCYVRYISLFSSTCMSSHLCLVWRKFQSCI